MQICRNKDELREFLSSSQLSPRVLVPTMGALHAGHASLLQQGRALAGENGLLVATVFLNPVQFNQSQDLANYPCTPEADVACCESCGVDVLFMPSVEDMYAPDRSILLEERVLSQRLCGATRPGHFAGVCLIVHKLFNLISPTDAIFGKKDYQQLAIIKRLVRDMDIAVRIHGAETVRADDGLALSSRNELLLPEHRAVAPIIRRELLTAKQSVMAGAAAQDVLANLRQQLESLSGVQVDYAELLDADNLQEVSGSTSTALLAVAAFFGAVRLIDNIEIPLT